MAEPRYGVSPSWRILERIQAENARMKAALEAQAAGDGRPLLALCEEAGERVAARMNARREEGE